jgi:hypothetical protein
LRYVENLRDKEEMVHAYEPETGINLSDVEDELISLDDLKDCQEGRDESSNCQVGNEMRSLEDLIDCQEEIHGNSNCQEGTEMGSIDPIDCQVGRGREEISYCQLGKGENMSSEVSSYRKDR